LNGIIGHRAFVTREEDIPADQKPGYEKRADGWYWKSYPADGSRPNILRQAAEFFVLGRNYINVVSAQDDVIEQIIPRKIGFSFWRWSFHIPFFAFSDIICQKQRFNFVYASPDTLRQDFKVLPGGHYNKGDVIARGAVDTGDQVFVDKFSYNFVSPHRGDVLSSGPITSRRFPAIPRPASTLFTSNDWPACRATPCASIRPFFMRTRASPRVLDSSGSWRPSLRIAVMRRGTLT